jgi:stringent starvation protein B
MSSNPLDAAGTSTRPYLIRALHEWCTDNGFTPYVAVHVDAKVQVPTEYVKNNEIVLNVGFEATSSLKLGNEAIEFKARFGGVAREIVVPIDHVVAIYARENGQGMAFPLPQAQGLESVSVETRAPGPSVTVPHLAVVDPTQEQDVQTPSEDGDQPPPTPGPRPALKRVK